MTPKPRWHALAAVGGGLLVIVGLVLAGLAGGGWFSDPQGSGPLRPVPASYRLLGNFTPMFSRMPNERTAEWSREGPSEPLWTRDGREIARVAPAFRRQLDTEGSAQLRDGRVVNLDQKVGARQSYLLVPNAPFGLGATGYARIPYRTVTVDPARIPPNTVLYLPALDGVQLPSGEVHDGLAFAHDQAGDLQERRIGLFVGFEDESDNALARSGRISADEPVSVYQVDAATALRAARRHGFGLAACAQCTVSVPGSYALLGEFIPTFYRILDESDPEWSSQPLTEALHARDGKLIARVPPAFKRQLDIEGSARLRDGRVVNLDARLGKRQPYLVVRHAPFGLAAPGYQLIPYRTVAVDPKVIPLGTVLYLPSLAGVQLLSGEVHDGFVFADDIGHGIEGRRIDIFVGFEADLNNALTRAGGVPRRFDQNDPVLVYRVDTATAARVSQRFERAEHGN